MQEDGNFVVYARRCGRQELTPCELGRVPCGANDGNLVVYSLSGSVLWSRCSSGVAAAPPSDLILRRRGFTR